MTMMDAMAEPGRADATDRAATADTREVALHVDRVSKEYTPLRIPLLGRRQSAKDVRALSSVSLEVRQGEMVGLLGPNGAGKTTLLKIITTLIYPTSGRVLIHGTDITKDPIAARAKMGLVTCDERSFYWRLTGQQNLEFFARLYGLDKAQSRRRIAELLDMLSLSHAANRPYQKYSSGMRQKLAVARGLLSDPRIIFYDEPTRSLDPLSSQAIRSWIMEKRRHSPEQTHVIATNQLGEAEQMCDRVFIVNRGQLIVQGSVAEIRRKYPLQDYDSHLLICRGHFDLAAMKQVEIGGLMAVSDEGQGPGGARIRIHTAKESDAFSEVLRHLLDAGVTIVDAHTEQVSFDDVFCSLVDSTHDRTETIPEER